MIYIYVISVCTCNIYIYIYLYVVIILALIHPYFSNLYIFFGHAALKHSSCATVSILRVCPLAGVAVKDFVLDPALQLSTSTLLQDPALTSLLNLFKQMMQSDAIVFNELYTLLLDKLTPQTSKHGIYNLAKCIAAIAAVASSEKCQSVLDDIILVVNGSDTPSDPMGVSKVKLSLLITGDLGRSIDLSTKNDVASRLKDIYLGFFESTSEELKNAAAYSLGNAAVGSPATFLHAIVGQLDEENKKHQYLLLSP